MIFTRLFSLIGIVSVSLSCAYADTKRSDIELNVTHTQFIKFSGTAAGASRMYSNTDIANWINPTIVDIGTLGIESNLTGNCDINMTTANNFRLLHTINGRNLTNYKVLYQSQEFGRASNPTLTVPCSLTPTPIQFTPTGIVFGNLAPNFLISSGIYQDVITLVVTTQ